jgi:hypothetical protein
MIQCYWNAKTTQVLSRNLKTLAWTLHGPNGGVPITDKEANAEIQRGMGTDYAGNPNWRVQTLNIELKESKAK